MKLDLTVPQIIDIIMLVIILITAIKAFINGFFAAVVDLVGNIVGLIASWILANRWAPMLYEKFFQERIVGKIYSYIQNSANNIDLQSLVQNFTGNLPLEFLQKYITNTEALAINIKEPTMEVATAIAQTIVGPLVTIIITVVIFAVLCSVCSLLASLLAKVLKTINKIPVIGFANRLGGFAVGVFAGVVNVIIISCVLSIIAIITKNSLPAINMEVLGQSQILSLTSIINPFMG